MVKPDKNERWAFYLLDLPFVCVSICIIRIRGNSYFSPDFPQNIHSTEDEGKCITPETRSPGEGKPPNGQMKTETTCYLKLVTFFPRFAFIKNLKNGHFT